MPIQHGIKNEHIRPHSFISLESVCSIHGGRAFTVVIKALEYSPGKSSIYSLVKAPSSEHGPLCVIWAANIDIFLIVKVSSPLRTPAGEWGFEWRVLMLANGRAYTACHRNGRYRMMLCYQTIYNSMRTCSLQEWREVHSD